MALTDNRNYPYPSDSQVPDVTLDLETLAKAIDEDVQAVETGTLASAKTYADQRDVSYLANAHAYADQKDVTAAAGAVAAAKTYADGLVNPRTLEAGEHLDTVPQGHYTQVYTDRPTLALGYPVPKIGDLEVRRWNSAGTHLVQEYFPLDEPSFYSRVIYSDVPRPWRQHEDAAASRAYIDAQINALRSEVPTNTAPATIPRSIVAHTEPGHTFYVPAGTQGTWELNDATDYAVGSQSLRLTTAGLGVGASIKADNIGPIDLTYADLEVWVKVDDWSTFAGLSIFLGTNGMGNYYQWSINSPAEKVQLQAGSWHLLGIPFISHNKISGNPDRSNLTHLQITATDTAAGPATCHFGPLYELPKSPKFPDGVVSFSFDDTLVSQYTQARAVMDKYGFGGTAYVTTEIVGASGCLSLEQLHLMQDHSGWEIAGHSFTGAAHNARFDTLTEAELDTELSQLAQWLKDNRFNGTSLAYPGGSYNDLVKKVTRRYFKAGRSISQLWETLPPNDLGCLKTAVYVLSGSTTVDHAKAMIDQAYAGGYWLHFCFHDVIPVPVQTTDYPTADFEAICAYIAAKGIPMRTVRDVLATVVPD